MRAAATGHTVACMAPATRTSSSDLLAHVYSAAFAASGDEGLATVVADGLVAPTAGCGRDALSRERLMERGRARHARRAERGFAAMLPEDCAAVALARLMGYSAEEVALALGTSVEYAKRRMLRGLRNAAAMRREEGALELIG